MLFPSLVNYCEHKTTIKFTSAKFTMQFSLTPSFTRKSCKFCKQSRNLKIQNLNQNFKLNDFMKKRSNDKVKTGSVKSYATIDVCGCGETSNVLDNEIRVKRNFSHVTF